jgi:hypothetical protein
MKLLSAKNKKYGIWALAALGALFIIGTLVALSKAGAKSFSDYANGLWAEIKELFTFQSVVTLLGVGVALYSFNAVLSGDLVQALVIGTLTTGAAVVSTFNTTYIPKMFHYTAATQLTGVKITVAGKGVIFDSDANGLTHMGVVRVLGQVTNKYTFRLADSFIENQTVTWEFTNSAAQTPTIGVESDQTKARGEQMYLQALRQAILANSGQNFTDFATLSLPSLGASDQVNITFRDGTTQQFTRDDVLERLQYTQNVVNTPVYIIDNFFQNISLVNVICTAAQTAYVQRWAKARGPLNQLVNF